MEQVDVGAVVLDTSEVHPQGSQPRCGGYDRTKEDDSYDTREPIYHENCGDIVDIAWLREMSCVR
jgi:hypothetical protein